MSDICCFPEDIFENKLLIQDLICPIDLNIPFIDNIITDIHGHSLCKVCIKEWFLVKHTCPQTNQKIEKNQLFPQGLFSKNILSKLEVSCLYHANGCKWKDKYPKIQQHIQNDCFYHIMKCKNIGCNQRLKKIELQKHYLVCQFQILECIDCSCSYSQQQQQIHQKICNKQKIKCIYCERFFYFDDIQQHVSVCVDKFIRCSHCHLLIQRNYFRQHVQLNYKKHKNLSKQFINNSETQSQIFFSEFLCKKLQLGFLKDNQKVINMNYPLKIISDQIFINNKNQLLQSCTDGTIYLIEFSDMNSYVFDELFKIKFDHPLKAIIQISQFVFAGYSLNKLVILEFLQNDPIQLNVLYIHEFGNVINAIHYDININHIFVGYGCNLSVIQICKQQNQYDFYEIKTLKEHQDRIQCILSLNDGKFFVSGGYDGKLVIWNHQELSFNNAFILRINKLVDKLKCLALTENNHFVSGTTLGVITLWNIYGKIPLVYLFLGPLFHIQNEITIECIKYIQNGYLLVGDKLGFGKVWNLSDHKMVKQIYKGHSKIQNMIINQENDSILFSSESVSNLLLFN